ncbi:hypothetical protein ZWY2020_025846, partial [Hordeum vulgare]
FTCDLVHWSCTALPLLGDLNHRGRAPLAPLEGLCRPSTSASEQRSVPRAASTVRELPKQAAEARPAPADLTECRGRHRISC